MARRLFHRNVQYRTGTADHTTTDESLLFMCWSELIINTLSISSTYLGLLTDLRECVRIRQDPFVFRRDTGAMFGW